MPAPAAWNTMSAPSLMQCRLFLESNPLQPWTYSNCKSCGTIKMSLKHHICQSKLLSFQSHEVIFLFKLKSIVKIKLLILNIINKHIIFIKEIEDQSRTVQPRLTLTGVIFLRLEPVDGISTRCTLGGTGAFLLTLGLSNQTNLLICIPTQKTSLSFNTHVCMKDQKFCSKFMKMYQLQTQHCYFKKCINQEYPTDTLQGTDIHVHVIQLNHIYMDCH